ncbi:hypothetical protein DB032_21555 [Chromobacterium sp. Panama]|nr:hypothetical protein DB032_21555 [Chromobacterium sp. Panama]
MPVEAQAVRAKAAIAAAILLHDIFDPLFLVSQPLLQILLLTQQARLLPAQQFAQTLLLLQGRLQLQLGALRFRGLAALIRRPLFGQARAPVLRAVTQPQRVG